MSEEQSLDLVEAPETAAETTPNPETPATEEVAEGNLSENPAPGSEEPKSEQGSEAKDELPKGVTKRIAKLTQQKYEQRAKIEALEAEKREMQDKLNGLQPKSKEDFATEGEYLNYMVNQGIDSKLGEAELNRRQQALYAEQAEINAQVWSERVQSVKERLPDFAQVVGSAQVNLPEDAMTAITESEFGPEMAYHLAQNPTEANSLNYMDARARDRYLIGLEFQMRNNPISTPKPVTQASPTPQSHGHAGGVANPESMSIGDWMKHRNKQVGR
jgi:hypothetical protein